MAGVVSRAAGAVLSRELTGFLVELSVSLHKHAIYPSGHPSLEPAAARLTHMATRLLQDRSTLAFGVARHQLIIDGVATDPGQPVLRRLAETLHQHHLGAVSILPGVEPAEIYAALRALAQEPDSTPKSPSERPHWAHVRFHALTLDRLEIVDDETPAPAEETTGQPLHRRAQLWLGLANAAMARDAVLDSGDFTPPEPDDVAKAIDEHDGAAYDQVVVGYLLQIAEELKNQPAADHGALRRRTAKLIRALRPDTLQRLVTMGGNVSQRRAFVVSATTGMAMDSVVKILKAAAQASGQTISHGLVRMLSKLASHAETGLEQTRPIAEHELREQVDGLLSGWELADPSPDAYAKTLQHLATTVSSTAASDDAHAKYEVDPLHVVQTAIEVGGSGSLVARAIDRAIDAGHLEALRTLLSSLPPGSDATAELLRQGLSGPRALAVLVAQEPLDLQALDALLPSITVEGYEVLLDALITTESRGTRRKLLERLAPTDLDVAPIIVARLQDDRWYVQRNLLLLLERLRRVPAGFDVSPWTQHEDARVRYHGLSIQLNLEAEREMALRAALSDSDERVTRLGLVACQDSCPRPLIPTVASLATNTQASQEVRMIAVKALGACRDRQALETLLLLVHGGTTWLGRPKLAARSPVVLAGLRALSGTWSGDADARRLIDLARQSSDREFRQAVEGAA